MVDFKWHKNTASPHFRLLGFQERVTLCKKVIGSICKHREFLAGWKVFSLEKKAAPVSQSVSVTTADAAPTKPVEDDDEI